MPREPYDSGNPDHVRKRNAGKKLSEETVHAGIRHAWATQESRAYLWSLLRYAGVHNCTYKPGSASSATDSVFLEGIRQGGLLIEKDAMTHCPDLFLLAQQEASKKEKDSDE